MLYKIRKMRQISSEIHKIRDEYLVKIVKTHNKIWKNIDIDNEKELNEGYKQILKVIIDLLFECLEKVYSLILGELSDLFIVKKNVIIDLTNLLYNEDGKNLVDRLYEYYIKHKGQNAVYKLNRLLITEVEYVFSGILKEKIDLLQYNYFIIDNLDETSCDDCPRVYSIYPIEAAKPPYHPECECFWIPMTDEEINHLKHE